MVLNTSMGTWISNATDNRVDSHEQIHTFRKKTRGGEKSTKAQPKIYKLGLNS